MAELITARPRAGDGPGDLGRRLSQPTFFRNTKVWMTSATYDGLKSGGYKAPIGLGRGFPVEMKQLVSQMLADHPFKRPTAIRVYSQLMKIIDAMRSGKPAPRPLEGLFDLSSDPDLWVADIDDKVDVTQPLPVVSEAAPDEDERLI